jgi:hypothetical protein
MCRMEEESRGQRSGAWRWFALGLAGLVVLALGIALTLAMMPPPAPPLPRPNGYDDLLAAAKAVQKTINPQMDIAKASPAAIRSTLQANREALALARVGLGRESRVPLRYRATEINVAIERAQALRGLARLLTAKASLAEQEGRTDAAVRGGLDLIKLGQSAGRGGLLIESQVGLAIEGGYGLQVLRTLRDHVPTEMIPEVLESLAEADRRAERFEDVAAREWAFARTSQGWRGVIMLLFPQARAMVAQSLGQAEEGFLRVRAKRRLVQLDLAVRLYRERHGAFPDDLRALVPEVLGRIPADPFSDADASPVYRNNGESFELYSVGPDGDDDGMTPYDPRNPEAGGDYSLNSGL